MVPVITLSQAQVGRLSFSARYASSGFLDTLTNATLLACCEHGPLYQFFATAYPTDEAMLDEWAASGGLISVQSTGATVPVPSFLRDGDGKPMINMSATAPAPVSIRVALSYSASR